MFVEAAVTEFPFVAALPKREKSKLAKVWELKRHLDEATQTEGQLIPVTLAAKCLDVGRTRVDQFCAAGQLRRVVVDGHVFISGKSLMELAATERKNGRPTKLETLGDAVRVALRPSRK